MKEGSQRIFLSVILIDSVFRTGKNYYPQKFSEECKYILEEKKLPESITNDIEILLLILTEKILMEKFPTNKVLMYKILMKKILMKEFKYKECQINVIKSTKKDSEKNYAKNIKIPLKRKKEKGKKGPRKISKSSWRAKAETT